LQFQLNAAPTTGEQLLRTLEQLLAIRSPELRPALNQAAMPLLEAVGADKIDVFLYQADSATLEAVGRSDTPVGRRQKALGLDRLPLANGGRVVQAFQTGGAFLSGQVEQDQEELRGVREGLGVRSEMNVAVNVNGERRGVLSAISVQPDKFTEQDLGFLMAVAGCIGMIADRAELAEVMADQAFHRGQRKAAEEVPRLTARQREVAACIAEGLTNEEIAERLVLLNGTVANHVAAILNRLGLRNRTQIAAWAVERGLYRSEAEANVEADFGTRPSSMDGSNP